MSLDKPHFKILSIDGGGIKGLYSATILEHLEQKYGMISDYFDMICGTSTGGLIALALTQKISASSIRRLYEEQGEKIFPKQNKIRGIFKQAFWGGKYSDKALREVLTGLFGTATIGDSSNLLCIPAYCYTDGKPWVFKYDHGKLERDNKALCVDIALATSAAPTYFPLCEIECFDNRQFIDGGVWANNPTLVGIIEALTYFVGDDKPFGAIQILSLSTLNKVPGKAIGLKKHRSFIDWRKDLFETSLIGQSHFTNYMMEKLSAINKININYVRIPSEEISSEQQHLAELDSACPKAIKFIRGKGNNRGLLAKQDPVIEQFFKEHKHYKF